MVLLLLQLLHPPTPLRKGVHRGNTEECRSRGGAAPQPLRPMHGMLHNSLLSLSLINLLLAPSATPALGLSTTTRVGALYCYCCWSCGSPEAPNRSDTPTFLDHGSCSTM